ncbi:MAG: DUF2298 domain-containing protein [Acidimicrobiales bacterium]
MRLLRAHPTAARRMLLGSILLVAFMLRAWNLDWDEGTHQHPDERYWSIVTDDISWPGFTGYFDSIGSELNPYTDRSTWVYGTAPLFATKATAAFLADGPFPAGAIVTTADTLGIELRTDGTDAAGEPVRVDAFDAGYNANLIGRLLSALIDTATVALVYLLGRRLWDRRVGLVGAALATFCVLSIQYSHFHGAEAWVTFFVTAAVLVSLRLADGQLAPRVAAGAGVLLGLAAASKLIAVAALVVPATALAVAAGPAAWRELRHRVRRVVPGAPPPRRTDLARTTQAVIAGIVVLATTAFTFRVFQPYAFEGIISLDERFTADLTYLSDVNAGGNVPWVVQWIDRTPLWFPLQSAFWWGMGPALALAVAAGVALAVRDVVRYRRYELLVPLVLIAVMLGLVSQQFNPLIRYLLPAYPTAIALAAAAVVRAFDVGRRTVATRPLRARALQVGAIAVVAVTAFWGLAFVNGVYDTEHPRIEASRWMAENLPPDAAISAQIWDDALPLAVPGTEGFAPTLVSFDPFAPDSSVDPETGRTKVDELLADLDSVDYVVEASNRIYDSVRRVPAKYPATTAYYDALFDGSLGFERIARFRNQPSLFGIDLPSHDAEETFTVYDHPTVTIWRKTDAFSVERARAILNPSRAALAPDLVPAEASTNAIALRPDALAQARTGETFSEAFTDDGAIAATPWLWWLVWIQLAAFAVLPWTTRLFAPLADHGYGLSKVIGFTAVSGLAWATTAWGVADSGRALSWFWMAVLVGAGATAWWHQRHRIVAIASQARVSWAASELVFLSVFGLALWLRAANPDLWEAFLGGEKPMELAYITAIGRSGELPAPDPWFGGGAMNYYYLGWYLLTVPMRALRLLPEVAFNLGVATYAAMTATVAFSTVHNLVALGTRRARNPASAPIGAGLLGVVLLCGIGNYDAIRQHIDRLQSVNTWTGPADWPVVGPVVAVIGGSWAWISGTPLPRFDWWGPSRVNSGNIDITEFPYFTFLFGDLHPHMMGMVFVGLAASVALAYLVAAHAGDRRRTMVLAVGLGVVTAVSRMVNTWDLPTVAILAVGAIVIGQVIAPRRDRIDAPTGRAAVLAVAGLAVGLSSVGGAGGAAPLVIGAAGACGALALVLRPGAADRLLRAVGHLGAVAAVHVVATWPYVRTTETYDTGIGGAVATTPLDDHLTHWGLFLTIAVALAAGLIVDERRRRRWDDDPVALVPGTDAGDRIAVAVATGALALAALLALFTTSAVFALGVIGSVVMLALGVREIRRSDPDIGRIVVLGMFALGFAISSGVDLITLENDIERMNTVFKFWLQAWQLFALAAAAAVWQVVRILRDRPSGGQRSSQVWVGVVAVLVLAGLAYPLLGTQTRVETRFAALPATLDGLEYLDADPVIWRLDDPDGDGQTTEVQVRIADDLPLIEWLRDNVAGTPTVAEWAGPAYDWNARIATHTGMQAVVGWEWHQRQQRWTFQETVGQRVAATQRFFRNADQAEATRYLQAHDVAYVVVGTQERRFGTPEALAAIADHPALVEVFAAAEGDGRIYAVDREALWAQPVVADALRTDENA